MIEFVTSNTIKTSQFLQPIQFNSHAFQRWWIDTLPEHSGFFYAMKLRASFAFFSFLSSCITISNNLKVDSYSFNGMCLYTPPPSLRRHTQTRQQTHCLPNILIHLHKNSYNINCVEYNWNTSKNVKSSHIVTKHGITTLLTTVLNLKKILTNLRRWRKRSCT